jgi:hypothetical protein
MEQGPTSEVTQFRIRDLDLTPTADRPTLPLVNVSYSHDLGAGIVPSRTAPCLGP